MVTRSTARGPLSKTGLSDQSQNGPYFSLGTRHTVSYCEMGRWAAWYGVSPEQFNAQCSNVHRPDGQPSGQRRRKDFLDVPGIFLFHILRFFILHFILMRAQNRHAILVSHPLFDSSCAITLMSE
ncbi:hypothetical protein KCU88_g205, partial [Aureobasidium melanogenum]